MFKTIANKLGVDLEERFRLYNELGAEILSDCYLHKNGLASDTATGNFDNFLVKILRGEYTIKKFPFRPKTGQIYYTIMSHPDEELFIEDFPWQDTIDDYMCYLCGNCFKTYEEADSQKVFVLGKLEERFNNSDILKL